MDEVKPVPAEASEALTGYSFPTSVSPDELEQHHSEKAAKRGGGSEEDTTGESWTVDSLMNRIMMLKRIYRPFDPRLMPPGSVRLLFGPVPAPGGLTMPSFAP
ncbi:LOW QUALITY PROTEIN: hypothetical protein CVT25_008620 [Psilocybe cyanescens]|uniref:Uncharacterized protein n=1 Tax=Psilocybe cyanescens TaxID=93625 RepID=A0A409XDG2_PSICY|nr:LOW QUALITY PROTEIN: hypothetical protein CVT25_008620 [Psilocybe cyanescens]